MGTGPRPAPGGGARDAHLYVDIRIGRHWKREHVHSDRQEQAYAHGHQLLSVQSSRVGFATAGVRIAARNLPDMVQVGKRMPMTVRNWYNSYIPTYLSGYNRRDRLDGMKLHHKTIKTQWQRFK